MLDYLFRNKSQNSEKKVVVIWTSRVGAVEVVRNGWILDRQWKQNAYSLLIHILRYSGALSRSMLSETWRNGDEAVPSPLKSSEGGRDRILVGTNHLVFLPLSFLLIEGLLCAKRCAGRQQWMQTNRLTALMEQTVYKGSQTLCE